MRIIFSALYGIGLGILVSGSTSAVFAGSALYQPELIEVSGLNESQLPVALASDIHGTLYVANVAFPSLELPDRGRQGEVRYRSSIALVRPDADAPKATLWVDFPEGVEIVAMRIVADRLFALDAGDKRILIVNIYNGAVEDWFLFPEEAARPTDLTLTPDGTCWVMCPPHQIWSIDPDGERRVALEAFGTHVEAAPSGRFLYTQSGAFAVEPGGTLAKTGRVILEMARASREISYFGGFATDERGNLWIARAGARTAELYQMPGQPVDRTPARLQQLDAQGQWVRDVLLPGGRVWSVAWGGHGRDTLFVFQPGTGLVGVRVAVPGALISLLDELENHEN